MRVQFTNYNAFAAAMAGLPEALTQKMIEATEKACETVRDAAVSKCPKDTAELSQSIMYNPVTVSNGQIKGIVGSNSNHAIYVHEGTGIYSRTGMGRKEVPWTYQDPEGNYHRTSGIPPTPFLEQARDENVGRISDIFRDVVGDFATGGGT